VATPKKTAPPNRPKKSEDEKEKKLKFSVQPDLHEYLKRLADTKFVAGSPDLMAKHVLIEALEQRRQSKYLGVEFNPPSKRSET
jgi:hypothetical protein